MGKDFSWSCHRTGDCCLMAHAITITPSEKSAIEAAAGAVIDTIPHPTDARFLTWRMPTGCPLLARDVDGKARCTVYEARPMNCRRFMCLRDEDEPYRPGGPMGCRNLSERVERNLHALEFYRTHQRHAQREWADRHGWTR